jgi:hypothetical protein
VTVPPASRPPALVDHRMAYFGGKIVLFGGHAPPGGPPIRDVYGYDPAGPAWSKIALSGAAPAARWGHGLAVVPDAFGPGGRAHQPALGPRLLLRRR